MIENSLKLNGITYDLVEHRVEPIPEETFLVGDFVRISSSPDKFMAGKCGKVIQVTDPDDTEYKFFGVEFPFWYKRFHTCGGRTEMGHGYYLGRHELIHVVENECQ